MASSFSVLGLQMDDHASGAKLQVLGMQIDRVEQSVDKLSDTVSKLSDTVLENSRLGLANQHETALILQEMSFKIQSLEKKMNIAEPQIQEFVEIRTQVQAAGKLGKWAWSIGGVILGVLGTIVTWAVALRGHLLTWMASS